MRLLAIHIAQALTIGWLAVDDHAMSAMICAALAILLHLLTCIYVARETRRAMIRAALDAGMQRQEGYRYARGD